MAYVVEFSPAARRQFRKFDPPVVKRIIRRIERLEKQPRPQAATRLLGSTEPLYRVREGDCRIVYTIEEDRLVVLVVRIGHRSEVYR